MVAPGSSIEMSGLTNLVLPSTMSTNLIFINFLYLINVHYVLLFVALQIGLLLIRGFMATTIYKKFQLLVCEYLYVYVVLKFFFYYMYFVDIGVSLINITITTIFLAHMYLLFNHCSAAQQKFSVNLQQIEYPVYGLQWVIC